MGLFKKHNKDQCEVVAVGTGNMISSHGVKDPVFSKELMGQTIAFELEKRDIVSPCDGKIEVMFPTGHACAIRMKDGTGLMVHIGINTVELNGKGFKVLVKQGQQVKAGQPIVKLDLDFIREKGYDATTLLITTEPMDKKLPYIDFGHVHKGQNILKG